MKDLYFSGFAIFLVSQVACTDLETDSAESVKKLELKPFEDSGVSGSREAARKPSSGGIATSAVSRCSSPTDGRFACLTIAPPDAVKQHRSGISTNAIVPLPEWCQFDTVFATRTAACVITEATLTTFTVVDGVETVTGELNMDVWSYTYSSPDLGNWIYQISVSPWSGFGPALSASISGTGTSASGSCTTGGFAFPSQPLTPFLTPRSGEANFNTTATAVGAVGFCDTTWNLTFTVPGHTPAGMTQTMSEIRCDNATGANLSRPRRVGCVVPWYPSSAGYSQSRYPSLTSHVARAQGSGLPGATFAAPLFRSTNEAFTTQNRNLACGDAPSIAGLSCDEYPLASTYNGLTFGGTRRSFAGCNINAPTATGPTGASACMITAAENSAQGAIMAAFYYDERVLDFDPYLIAIVN